LSKLTGPELIELFRDYSEKCHKLYIPDVNREEPISDSLAKHYDSDLLEKSVKWYIDNNPGPFLIFDFAIQSRDIVEKVKYEEASVSKFKDIVQETKRRMESQS
jgi:hypothetical protein